MNTSSIVAHPCLFYIIGKMDNCMKKAGVQVFFSQWVMHRICIRQYGTKLLSILVYVCRITVSSLKEFPGKLQEGK